MSYRDMKLGDLLDQAEAMNAGSIALSIRDAADKVQWAAVVICGDGADELYAAWEAAEKDVQDRWEAERRAQRSNGTT